MFLVFHILAFAFGLLRESIERPETQREIHRLTTQILHDGLHMLHSHIQARAEHYRVS